MSIGLLPQMSKDYRQGPEKGGRVAAASHKRPVLLVVDPDAVLPRGLRPFLKDHFRLLTAGSGSEALDIVKVKSVDLVLMDIKQDGDGLKIIRAIKDLKSSTEVIIVSPLDSARMAVEALRLGALDYITSPVDSDELKRTLKDFAERKQSEPEPAKEILPGRAFMGIISRSPKMKRVFDIIRKVSRTSSSVLITGPSGTGKELVARAIHMLSPRRDKPFVAVNCGAVPSELMESELFGHEKGAFTGAHARKIGKFEYADGGTVFLDEVSTLPMHLQVKLLRVLQEKSFERVGGNKPIEVDIRIIAATNVDLYEAVKQGRFREDLYYRLKVVPIELPPLSERKEDIPLLVEHFLERHSKKCHKHIKGISPEVLAVFSEYNWPGNVRELENLVERLVVLAKDGSMITREDLSHSFFNFEGPDQAQLELQDFREACRFFERRYILNVLEKTNWNRAKAARIMKIHRNTLLMKMKELGILNLRPKKGGKSGPPKQNGG